MGSSGNRLGTAGGCLAMRLGVAALVAAATAFVLLCVGAAVSRAEVPSGNLVQNPGAEDGQGAGDATTVAAPPMWSTTSNFTAVQYGAPGFPSQVAGGGTNFFAGGPGNASSLAEQLIDVSQAAPEIDAGRVSVELSGLLGGVATQEDNAKVTAELEDAHSDTTFATLQIGPVDDAGRGNQTTLVARSASTAVPAGTRRIRVNIVATRTGGAYNDGYADNVSVVLHLADEPSPGPGPGPGPDPMPPPTLKSPLSARFTASPNPACVGLPVRFDASDSTSPDGIANYRFEFEAGVEIGPTGITSTIRDGAGATAAWTFDWVTRLDEPIRDILAQIDYLQALEKWTRGDGPHPGDPPIPGGAIRPNRTVRLTVTGVDGAQATATRRIQFAQKTPDEPRAGCPRQPRRVRHPASFTRASSTGSKLVLSGTCVLARTCVGALVVSVPPSVGRRFLLRRTPQSHRVAIAGGPFTVPAQSTKRVRVRLTRRGKQLLQRRRRVPAQVAILSIAPNGEYVAHKRKITLKRQRR